MIAALACHSGGSLSEHPPWLLPASQLSPDQHDSRESIAAREGLLDAEIQGREGTRVGVVSDFPHIGGCMDA